MNGKKIVYGVIGCIGVGLGAAGVVLPILLTVPFLLLAAYCFARSSTRLQEWFVGTKLYKKNLETVKGEGMTWKTKIRIMLTFTALMLIGFVMMDEVRIARIILTCVWIFHIAYFTLRVKTLRQKSAAEEM